MSYSSAFRRFLAFTIDCLTIMGIYVLLGFLCAVTSLFPFLGTLPMLGFWFYGGLVVMAWLYYALQESSRAQATLGKRVMGIKVVDLNGNRIGFWRASARYFGKVISRLTLMLGFLMVFFTKKRQALHDKMAKCLVISSRK